LTDEAARQQRERAQGLHSAAAQSFEQAANAFPDGAAGRGRAFNSLSVVALYFHHHEIAAKRAEQALKERFYTERYSALSNLGWAHYHRGDLVSATAQLRQAVLINPDYCVGHYRLAQVYLEAGQPQKAREHAQMVVDEPRCPIQDAYRILGVAIVRSGEAEGASEAFQGCTELAPRSCLAGECRKLLAPYVAQGEEQSGP
jgi:tetratricopeptide (TPR) repeat protein